MPDTSKSLYLEFVINHRCPLGADPTEAASIDVRPGEMTKAPKREAPASVLETDNSEASEHLSATKVRPSEEPTFSA